MIEPAKTMLIATLGGPLSRRTRWHIEHAPLGLCVKVLRLPKEVSGTRVNFIVCDEWSAAPQTGAGHDPQKPTEDR